MRATGRGVHAALAPHEWTLKRNCSMSPRQFASLIASLAIVSVGVASIFAYSGAWWILVFAFVEMAALVAAFVVYARHAGDYERIVVTPDAVIIEFNSGTEVVRQQAHPAFARVEYPCPGAGGRRRLPDRACPGGQGSGGGPIRSAPEAGESGAGDSGASSGGAQRLLEVTLECDSQIRFGKQELEMVGMMKDRLAAASRGADGRRSSACSARASCLGGRGHARRPGQQGLEPARQSGDHHRRRPALDPRDPALGERGHLRRRLRRDVLFHLRASEVQGRQGRRLPREHRRRGGLDGRAVHHRRRAGGRRHRGSDRAEGHLQRLPDGEGDRLPVEMGLRVPQRRRRGNQFPLQHVHDAGPDRQSSATTKNDHLPDGSGQPLVVPVNKKIRVVVTANDVIHAWGVPQLRRQAGRDPRVRARHLVPRRAGRRLSRPVLRNCAARTTPSCRSWST